jgi:hypothetical protein
MYRAFGISDKLSGEIRVQIGQAFTGRRGFFPARIADEQ